MDTFTAVDLNSTEVLVKGSEGERGELDEAMDKCMYCPLVGSLCWVYDNVPPKEEQFSIENSIFVVL
jgi:hypothetical protein